ncbi:MAG: hypothetical protein KDD70_10080 [Bdellovibrionales bacterium]|nr:hypothetical protein [Bdellovibrionales bacterium]
MAEEFDKPGRQREVDQATAAAMEAEVDDTPQVSLDDSLHPGQEPAKAAEQPAEEPISLTPISPSAIEQARRETEVDPTIPFKDLDLDLDFRSPNLGTNLGRKEELPKGGVLKFVTGRFVSEEEMDRSLADRILDASAELRVPEYELNTMRELAQGYIRQARAQAGPELAADISRKASAAALEDSKYLAGPMRGADGRVHDSLELRYVGVDHLAKDVDSAVAGRLHGDLEAVRKLKQDWSAQNGPHARFKDSDWFQYPSERESGPTKHNLGVLIGTMRQGYEADRVESGEGVDTIPPTYSVRGPRSTLGVDRVREVLAQNAAVLNGRLVA